MTLLLVGMAGILPALSAVLEIDPGSAGTAFALLCGTLLVLKSGRRK
jgi:hypothetical protein